MFLKRVLNHEQIKQLEKGTLQTKSGKSKLNSFTFTLLLVLLLTVLISVMYSISNNHNALVVYCSHDSVYSEKILRQFEKESSIKVVVKFDTEATKSIGLTELIKRERSHPRCDLFWNNETLGTMELKKEGLLHPYKGSGYKRIPDEFKDPDGYWCGFAARMRVYILNTDKVPEKNINPQFIDNELQHHPANFAIAKPLYGTTLTHFTVIACKYGFDELQRIYSEMLKSGVKVLNGNAAVKDAVAAGSCTVGWSDTDDFFSAKFANAKLSMLPILMKNGNAILIPNSVAIIAGTKKLKEAQQLADFLLSEKCEIMLANAHSRQIPLGKVNSAKLPDDVIKLKKWITNSVHLEEKMLPIRNKCITWLKSKSVNQ